jgi:hypothetical protein
MSFVVGRKVHILASLFSALLVINVEYDAGRDNLFCDLASLLGITNVRASDSEEVEIGDRGLDRFERREASNLKMSISEKRQDGEREGSLH